MMANKFLANLRHLIFQIFWGTMPPDPRSSTLRISPLISLMYVIYISFMLSVRVTIYLIIRRKFLKCCLAVSESEIYFPPFLTSVSSY
jgi:hypothetical protein